MKRILISSLATVVIVSSLAAPSPAAAPSTAPATQKSERMWQGYPRLSPFNAVRWNEQTPEVRVNDSWYELVAMNDLTAEQIVSACQSLDRKDWRKRFEEDLVEVLSRSGHEPPAK